MLLRSLYPLDISAGCLPSELDSNAPINIMPHALPRSRAIYRGKGGAFDLF